MGSLALFIRKGHQVRGPLVGSELLGIVSRIVGEVGRVYKIINNKRV